MAAVLVSTAVIAQKQTTTNAEGSQYDFEVVKNLEATPVQDQSRTATCWSFSALGFFESELIRMGKGEHNLSEMFVVNHTYRDKAEMYVRMHGKTNFGPGGAFHDISHVWEKYGMVPEEVFSGLEYGAEKHNHSELNHLLTQYIEGVVDNKQKSLTPVWKDGYSAVVNTYLGEIPEKFEYRGKSYTPKSFAESLELDMDDYISISSFTHHPFYEEFVLEVPDNWLYKRSYNVPLDEMMTIMENALMNGYTFAWGADVSEKGFNYRKGLAILPEDKNSLEQKGKDSENFNTANAERVGDGFMQPVKQQEVTQEQRQREFDNWETTDDHGMQITGIVKDQEGEKYFIVKNSWGNDNNDCGGYFYASYPYVRLKTMNILVHKDAISKDLKKKLEL